MNVKLPDGTIIENVPDNITRTQLVTKLKANGYDVPADWLGAPPRTASEKAGFVGGNVNKGIAGLLGMAADTGENLYNLGAAGVGSILDAAGRPDLAPNLLHGSFGTTEYLTNKAKQAGLIPAAAEPRTPGERYAARALQFVGGSLAPARTLPEAATQATLAALSGLGSQAAQDAFPNSPLAPVVGALAAPAAAPLALSAGMRLRNALRGNLDQSAAAMNNLAREHNVPITAGEASNNPIMVRAETALENVPVVGLGGYRKTQNQAAQRAAERVVSRYEVPTENPAEEVHSSLRRVLEKNKAKAEVLYNNVENQLTGPINNRVPLSKTRDQSVILLQSYPDIFERLPSQTVKAKLQTIAQGAARKPEITFQDARFLRKQLGNYIDRAQRSAGAVGSEEMRQLVQVKSALDADLNQFGKLLPQNSKAYRAWKTANRFYQENVTPFRDSLINKATHKDFDTDTIFKMFVKPDRPNLANKLQSRLDPAGQAALKYGVLKHAYEEALNGERGIFSPQKFARAIDKMGKTTGAIFTPAEREQLRGFTKLMSAVKRAGQYLENPPTGNRIVQTGGLIGSGYLLHGHPLALAGSAATAQSISLLLTTNAGKRLLLAAAKTPEQGEQMQQLIKRAVALSMNTARAQQQANQ